MNLEVNNLEVIHNKDKKRFEVKLGDKMAFIDYFLEEEHIIFLHTEVPAAFEGKGIAGMMARAALDYSDQHNLRVTSLCSYVSLYIQRHPEYHGLKG